MSEIAQVRGLLLTGWGAFVRARFGPDVVAAIQREKPEILDDPQPLQWFDVAWQLHITERVMALGCHGDETATIASLVDYGIANADPMSLRAARWLGPKRVLQLAPKIHPHLYNVGECASSVQRKSATLRWTGSALFCDPTWRLLQHAALQGVLAACRKEGDTEECGAGPQTYALSVRWR